MKKKVLVVGSIAFDVIFDIHGKIKDSIVIEGGKAGRQNLMFTSKVKQERYGGTGANIAYGLGLLGVKPILFGSVGKDFRPHFYSHLESHGVDIRVHIEKNDWTAAFVGLSDELKEQIGLWQPNAHDFLETISITDTLDKKTLREVSVAIFCGKPSIALRHMRDVRKIVGKKPQIIFDPGQMITFYDIGALRESLSFSNIFIANDVELAQARKILNCSTKDFFNFGPHTIIETRGEKGSVIYDKKNETIIIVVVPAKVVETTGAGDAYRAGLIHGLLKGFSLKRSCEVGSYMGAKSVESYGAQTYKILKQDIL